MNGWPPNPVCTLMTRSRSISARYGATAANGVCGSNESPTRMPSARISSNNDAWIAELDVHGAPVGAGIGETREQRARVVDHEVAVEEEVGVLAQRLHDRRADREVRHVVPVHAVDVQQVGDVGDARDIGGEVGEIGGEDRGRDLHRAEAMSPVTSAGHLPGSG